MCLVHKVQLVHVEHGGLFGDPGKVEHPYRLFAGEYLPVVAGVPPQQGEIVEQGVGMVAHVPVLVYACCAVTL